MTARSLPGLSHLRQLLQRQSTGAAAQTETVRGDALGRGRSDAFIEQLKNGIAAMRMPTGELLANGAFLMAGQLAWCLRAWLSLPALLQETIRWEWKWFRQSFVYVAAKVTQSARRAVVSLSAAHRWVEHLLIASRRLQSFAFR